MLSNSINVTIQNIYAKYLGRYNLKFYIVLFSKDIKSKPFCFFGGVERKKKETSNNNTNFIQVPFVVLFVLYDAIINKINFSQLYSRAFIIEKNKEFYNILNSFTPMTFSRYLIFSSETSFLIYLNTSKHVNVYN